MTDSDLSSPEGVSAVPANDRFPVSFILERPLAPHPEGQTPELRLLGFVGGQAFATGEPSARTVRADEHSEQLLCTGYELRLYRDSAESYWYNLVGEHPSLFLVCRIDGDGDLQPYRATANYDEAGAHMEADDLVLSAPMPPEIYRWLEAFVMEHFRPTAPRKRKRENWKKDGRSRTSRFGA